MAANRYPDRAIYAWRLIDRCYRRDNIYVVYKTLTILLVCAGSTHKAERIYIHDILNLKLLEVKFGISKCNVC